MASPLTLAEVCVGPARSGRLDRATAALQLLDVRCADLGGDAPLLLALLRAGTGLKLPDCCVLSAAEMAAADVGTVDDRLADAARERGLHVRDG